MTLTDLLLIYLVIEGLAGLIIKLWQLWKEGKIFK